MRGKRHTEVGFFCKQVEIGPTREWERMGGSEREGILNCNTDQRRSSKCVACNVIAHMEWFHSPFVRPSTICNIVILLFIIIFVRFYYFSFGVFSSSSSLFVLLFILPFSRITELATHTTYQYQFSIHAHTYAPRHSLACSLSLPCCSTHIIIQ